MIQLNTDTIKVKENGQWSNLSSLTGPQGERGAKGETGAQGPQGIQGEPGYPTIATGDAGKVLTVNNGETGVEWTTFAGGLDIIWTGNDISQFTNHDVVVGKSAIIYGNTIFICARHTNDEILFLPLVYGDYIYNGGYNNRVNIQLRFINSYYDWDNSSWSEYYYSYNEVETGYSTSPIDQITNGHWTDGQTGKFQLVANVTHYDPDNDGGWNEVNYTWELVQ